MIKIVSAIAVAVFAAIAVAPFATPAQPAGPVHLRVNQVGYRPDEPKVAFALTNEPLEGVDFRVETASGSAVFTGPVGRDRGRYGSFAHLYELDLSDVTAQGVYRIEVGGDTSPQFAVGANGYRALVATTLEFFKVQRCGDTNPVHHGLCHLTDATARGGPRNGTHVDTSGGWHDAGDYLKFLVTQGGSVLLMLTAYDRNPEAFRTGAAIPPVLAEAQIGIEWISKLWDPERKVLYYQVGDGSDHDEWRLPEGDDAANPGRPAFACADGAGANVAGKAAAVLALSAIIWNDSSTPYYDPDRAARYTELAEQIYAYGKSRPQAQSTTDGFYDEESWVDDMSLAATELYRATGKESYLKAARKYSKRAGAAYTLDWGQFHALAHYELGRHDERSRARSARFLAKDLSAAQEYFDASQFGTAVPQYFWGCAASMTGAALEAFWYEDLTGDTQYRAMAERQRDYVLGANPWGVSFVNGAGTVWPHNPHHQIADLNGVELTGFWDEGPVKRTTFERQNITLRGDDVYEAFQSEESVYHDDTADYVTNEPTLDAAALGLAMTSWFASDN